mgnify:CR=1 FL=1
MQLKPAAAHGALTKLDPAIRLYVFGGPDESGSRALLALVARAMGPEAERIDLTPSKLRDDPAILPDEAASISMFGGARWICITLLSGSGDEILPAVEALLAATAAGNPVVVVGGGLTNRSKLTKLADKHPLAISVTSYLPEGAEADRIAEALAAPLGLKLDRDVARMIVGATGSDRGLMAQEITKLALYCDATPDQPQRADMASWSAIGADLAEEDVGDAVNIVLGGQVAALPDLFATIEATGLSDIRLVRALATRALILARLRAQVDGGHSIAQAMDSPAGKAIFWKEQKSVGQQVNLWRGGQVARLISRLHQLERDLKAPDNAGTLLLRVGLTDICRQASSFRR